LKGRETKERKSVRFNKERRKYRKKEPEEEKKGWYFQESNPSYMLFLPKKKGPSYMLLF